MILVGRPDLALQARHSPVLEFNKYWGWDRGVADLRLACGHHLQVRVEIYISFGGLLMQLTGDPNKLEELEVDSNVYLLVRKV